MIIVSWNVNGIRSNIFCDGSMNKSTKLVEEPSSNLKILIDKYNPDIICIQETKCNIGDKILQFKAYPYRYWHCSEGEGARTGNRYSGTCILSKIKPLSYDNDFPEKEGRYMRVEFENFTLINVYTPNSGTNFEYRINTWDKKIRELLESATKPMIFAGDLNVVSTEKDIWNKTHLEKADFPGCFKEERDNFKMLLETYVDVYRHKYPDKIEYTWWNPRTRGRQSNRGWRIDYFLIQKKFFDMIKDTSILTDIMGSDHCPISIEF